MPKVPYLVKRGHVFWWRRRRPLFTLPQPSPGTDEASTAAGDSKVGGPGHFALSLRTPCPREAGRRVAALNLLFEEQRRRIEAAMAGEDGMSDQHFVERAMADMAAALRAQAEMLARQMSPTGPAVVAALPQEPSPPPISDAPPPPTLTPQAARRGEIGSTTRNSSARFSRWPSAKAGGTRTRMKSSTSST